MSVKTVIILAIISTGYCIIGDIEDIPIPSGLGKKGVLDCKSCKKANSRTMNFTEDGKIYLCKQKIVKEHKLYTFYKTQTEGNNIEGILEDIVNPVEIISKQMSSRRSPNKTKRGKSLIFRIDLDDNNELNNVQLHNIKGICCNNCDKLKNANSLNVTFDERKLSDKMSKNLIKKETPVKSRGKSLLKWFRIPRKELKCSEEPLGDAKPTREPKSTSPKLIKYEKTTLPEIEHTRNPRSTLSYDLTTEVTTEMLDDEEIYEETDTGVNNHLPKSYNGDYAERTGTYDDISTSLPILSVNDDDMDIE